MKPNISHPHTRIENVHWSDQLGVESHVNQTWSPKLCKTTRWIPKILKNCHLWPPAMQKPQQHPGVVHGSYAGPISHDITQHWSTPRAGRPTPGVRPAPTMRQVSWGSTGVPCRALWLFPTNPSRKLMMKNMTDDQAGWRNMSDKIRIKIYQKTLRHPMLSFKHLQTDPFSPTLAGATSTSKAIGSHLPGRGKCWAFTEVPAEIDLGFAEDDLICSQWEIHCLGLLGESTGHFRTYFIYFYFVGKKLATALGVLFSIFYIWHKNCPY